MKRTNLVLDEHLLEEATRLSGEKTYSAVVQRALGDLVAKVKARRILELQGTGAWEGELASMRRDADHPSPSPPRARSKRRAAG